MLLKAIYHVFAETFAVTAQKMISNDRLLRKLEIILRETHQGICLLCASKAPTVFFDVVLHGCRGDWY